MRVILIIWLTFFLAYSFFGNATRMGLQDCQEVKIKRLVKSRIDSMRNREGNYFLLIYLLEFG